MGLVGPLCTYMEADHGPWASVLDMFEQVKKSFTFEETGEFSLNFLGKIVVSNFLPIYKTEFYSRQFIVILIWFLLAVIYGSSSSCHLAVFALALVEILILLVSRSYLGFILDLLFYGDHVLVLFFRYLTLYSQYHGCGKCYWETVAYIIFFVPKSLLIVTDWLRGIGGSDFLRDSKGRFSKK